MQKLTIADAKQRVSIHYLWRQFGFPGEPRKSCRCPFHEDRNESFSIFQDGLRWKCFAGCGGGDALDFLRRARGFSSRDACREFLRLAGGGNIPLAPVRPRPLANQWPARRVELPSLAPGDESQRRTLATTRNVSLEGVALAAQRGLLAFGRWTGRAAWFVTDSTRRVAQARRMDALRWPEIGGKKAWTICPKGNANWPLGTMESVPFPRLAWCEGGPDLLAAFHFIRRESREADCFAVAMLGAALGIHPDALPFFAAKSIRIFGHADPSGAGDNAVERWAAQLTRAGATVDAFNFAGLRKADGSPVKDLNDCTTISAEQQPKLGGMLP